MARKVLYSFVHRDNEKKDEEVNDDRNVKDERRVIVSLSGVLQDPILARINYLITETERGGGG